MSPKLTKAPLYATSRIAIELHSHILMEKLSIIMWYINYVGYTVQVYVHIIAMYIMYIMYSDCYNQLLQTSHCHEVRSYEHLSIQVIRLHFIYVAQSYSWYTYV